MKTQEVGKVGTRLISDFVGSVNSIGDFFVLVLVLFGAALAVSNWLKRRGLMRAGKFRGWA